MLDRVDDISGASFALGADHGRAFGNTAERFAQVAGTADERHAEGVLVDVMGLVGRGEDLGFVDVVNAQLLQDLRLGKVPDAALGHHGNGDRVHDFANLLRRGHAGDAAFGPDLRGHALQRHDRHGSRLLGDGGLLGIGDVHDDAALQHLGKPGLQAQAISVVLRHDALLFRSRAQGGLFSDEESPFEGYLLHSGNPNVVVSLSPWLRGEESHPGEQARLPPLAVRGGRRACHDSLIAAG